MGLVIELPTMADQHRLNLERWQAVLADTELAESPDRIEMDRFGHLIFMPPASLQHASLQGEITFLLRQLLGEHAFGEIGVSTADGVKVADAAWMSPERFSRQKGAILPAEAPEICVEVLSPRNSPAEMAFKRQLYFNSGAQECWVCDLQGRMTFYRAAQPNLALAASHRCPAFPPQV